MRTFGGNWLTKSTVAALVADGLTSHRARGVDHQHDLEVFGGDLSVPCR
jgi:hypothetical protein